MGKNEILSRIRRKLEEQDLPQTCIEAILTALEEQQDLQASSIVFRKRDAHECLLIAKEQHILAHSASFHFSKEGCGFQTTDHSIPWLVTMQNNDILYVYTPNLRIA